MAATKVSYKGTYVDTHQEFVCDTVEDIANLPTQFTVGDTCPMGSKALVISDGSEWRLNSQGKWVKLPNNNGSGGSSGGGSIDNDNIATDEEIEEMLDEVFPND